MTAGSKLIRLRRPEARIRELIALHNTATNLLRNTPAHRLHGKGCLALHEPLSFSSLWSSRQLELYSGASPGRKSGFQKKNTAKPET